MIHFFFEIETNPHPYQPNASYHIWSVLIEMYRSKYYFIRNRDMTELRWILHITVLWKRSFLFLGIVIFFKYKKRMYIRNTLLFINFYGFTCNIKKNIYWYFFRCINVFTMITWRIITFFLKNYILIISQL